MRERTARRNASLGEEIASSVVHGVGGGLAITALVLLVVSSSLHGTAWHVVSCAVFGATLVLLYTASTLYHSIQHPTAKRVLQIVDHCAIYLLIAGTYTPITLVSLRGPWGWTLFGVVWGLALVGITLEVVLRRRDRRGPMVALYVVMGWTVLVVFRSLLDSVATGGLVLLIAGGVAYTAGLTFYGWRRLRFHHAVWHGFVVAGSVLHVLAILLYVIPPSA